MPYSFICNDCKKHWVTLWAFNDGEDKIVKCETCDNKFRLFKDKPNEYELIDPVNEVARAFNNLTELQKRRFQKLLSEAEWHAVY